MTDTTLSHNKAFLGPNSVVTTFCILQGNMKDVIYNLMTDLGKLPDRASTSHGVFCMLTVNKIHYRLKQSTNTSMALKLPIRLEYMNQ